MRAYFNWLYSSRSGLGLAPKDNPILAVDSPKVEKRLLPSLTEQQVETLIKAANTARDRCIISLLADSGMRLRELASVRAGDINWTDRTVTVIGKGNKQRKAPFTARSAQFLKAHLASNRAAQGDIWGIDRRAIARMLDRLGKVNGVKANPHAFRRGFACALHRRGLSTMDIMRLGGWESLSMVLRYTAAVTFDDCLGHYRVAFNEG